MDRVSEILGKRLLGGERPFWLLPRYRRRGRLVDYCLTLLGQGKSIEASWWEESSGEGDDDRVPHEECRPYVEGGQRWLAESRFKLTDHHIEVRHPTLCYSGHPDWIGLLKAEWVIDVKCGTPPAAKIPGEARDAEGHVIACEWDNPMELYERFQLELYRLAIGRPMRIANLHVFDGQYKFVERGLDRKDKHDAQIEVEHHHIMKRIGA